MAIAARANQYCAQIVGWDSSKEAMRFACRAGMIDAVDGELPALRDSDVVLLAVPPSAVPPVLALLAHRAGALIDQLVISDCASVKSCVVQAAQDLFGRVPPVLIPGHPLAGSERSGAAAADAELFRGRRVVLCPVAGTDPAALMRIEGLWRALGAEPVHLDAAEHDEVLARTSHLPHVAARALAAVGAPLRIAASNPSLWRDIERNNRRPLAAALRDHRSRLHSLASATAADASDYRPRFARAAELCRRLGLSVATVATTTPLQRLVAVAVLECLPERSDALSYAAGGLRDIAAAAAAPPLVVDDATLRRYVAALAA